MSDKIKNLNFVFFTGLGTVLLGIIVIVGWKFDIQTLMTIVPGYVSMKLNTALFFIFSGGIVMLSNRNAPARLSVAISAFLTIFALASLLQDMFFVNFGIDQMFMLDKVAIQEDALAPGRPSPVTSLCFSLFGLVFILIESAKSRSKKFAQYGLHLITFLSFIAIMGYLFNVPVFYKLSFFTSMAIHTSVSLFVLSVALSFVNPELGITGLFTGKRIGNVMAKNLFKKVMPAILILAFAQLVLQRLNIVAADFGIALFTTCFTLIVLYALWSTAKLLNGIDDKRKLAEDKIINTNRNLEKIVHERTEYLSRQNRQLEDFSYIISHNLRGPMSNLKSLLGFYNEEKTIAGKDKLMDYFNNTVNNLSETLDDLLEVVTIRHESKKERTLLAFEEVFSKLVESFQGQIMESGARVTSDFAEAPKVEYSSVYLESILQNLLSNALKYSSKDRVPTIHFKSRNLGDKIELLVSDNGLGMDMKVHGSRIFGLHKTFHKHPNAKGVGLFITKAQVEAMGGEIGVTSEVDKGTTFEIKF